MIKILYATFFATGFSALVYQVIWQRMLALFAGADITSATIVVGAFLGGLGLGSVAGGSIADRMSSRRALVTFAACNLGIACFAIASKALFYDLLFLTLPTLAVSRALTLVVSFLALLIPTTLMGLSLPILSRVVVRSIDGAARSISNLYAINTLGGAAGAVLGGWFLIARFGFVSMLQAGAVVNAAAGLVVAALLWRSAGASEHVLPFGDEGEVTASRGVMALSLRDGVWFFLVLVSGFMAMSLQIVWFRLFAVLFISGAFVFPLVLGSFLCFDAIGAALGAWSLPRIREVRRAYFIVQGLVILGSIVSIWFLMGIFQGIEAVIPNSESARLLPMLGLLLLLMGPQAMLIGFYFPLAHQAVQRDRDLVGLRTGVIDFGIVLGNTLGSTITGLLLLDAIGTTGTLRLLGVLGCLFLGAAVFDRGRRAGRVASAGILVALGLCVVAFPGQETLWTVFSRAVPHGEDIAFVVEDKSAVAVTIRERRKQGRRGSGYKTNLISTGIRLGSVEPFQHVHGFLGAIGSLTHPDPKEILIVGLGSAGTAYAAGINPRTERIDVVEIAASQREALDIMLDHAEIPALKEVIRGDRYRIIGNDGRRYLQMRENKYDIIEADPLTPATSGSGMLYSTEFFQLVRSRLKPGGIFVVWTPTERVRVGVARVFPYGVSIGRSFMLAGNEPVDLRPAVIHRLLEQRSTRLYLERGGLSARLLLKPLEFWKPGDNVPVGETNTDLFPRDEYDRFPHW